MSNRLERPASVFFISPEKLIEFEDLTRLPYLYDETVLECILHRYDKSFIYTWAGPILIAVNPFRKIEGFYSTDYIKDVYRSVKEGKDNQFPHIFSVAGLAHNRLVSQIGLPNQAILVSGESGAGKTESAKHLLTYLTKVENETPSSPLKGVWKGKLPKDVQRRILASNPILEAFGNSSTRRNHNSSRFGKLVRLQYNGFSLKGAEVDTYLLEKTRVTCQPAEERNFHIFYQFLAAINNGAIRDFDNLDVASFAITPKYDKFKDSDDYEAFLETKKAFERVSVDDKQLRSIFEILAALLYLGNIKFRLDEKKEFYSIDKSPENKHNISCASSYLGFDEDNLIEVLTVKKIVISAAKKTTVFSKGYERKEQCEERRDSLMQLVYSSVFSYLVAVINDNIKSSQFSSYLGILDVYGFESFDSNSLEQLCINYTNERLQQEFTKRYLASELCVLSEEGLMNLPLIYTDNARCVSALDSSISVFSILNEECQLCRAVNEDSTCERVCKALENTGIILPPSATHQKTGFVVKHYAGPVNYTALGLLHKNKAEVPNEINSLLLNSKKELVCQMAPANEEQELTQIGSKGTPTRRMKKKTTLAKFKSSLDSLMKILTNCDLHYVRCLKPNLSSVPFSPDPGFLCTQLKSNGILETVKISQAGYPVRMFYKEFVKRYSLKSHLNTQQGQEVSVSIAKSILGESLSADSCRFGKTRMFLSESALHKLEEVRKEYRNQAATCLQKYWRKHIAVKNYMQIRNKVVVLQKNIKCWVYCRRFLNMKAAAIIIQSYIRSMRESVAYRKKRNAALIIQKYTRGWLYRKRISKISSNSLRTYSRSSGYFSIATSLTDNSTSDAETLSIQDDIFKNMYSSFDARKSTLLETEESGMESDTESLSGKGLKDGRNSKFRNRRELTVFRSSQNVSDEDLSVLDESFNKVNKSKSGRSSQSKTSKLRSPSKPISRNLMMQLQSRIHDKEKSFLGSLLTDTLKHFRKAHCFVKQNNFCVQLVDPIHKLPIFFKDGILSYRRLAKCQIKFHTRETCLPFSTRVPVQSKSNGLLDAINERF